MRYLIMLGLLLGGFVSQAVAQDRWALPPRFATPLSAVTVTSSATLVCPANDNRVNCTCRNIGADAVRYGSQSGLTASTGARIAAGEPAEIRVRGAIYMISEGADTDVVCTDETY